MPAKNKNIVLISGGASGIGRCTAERFLAQGDAVHICDVSRELVDEFLAANPGATGTVADIGARDDVSTVFSDLERFHDRLDILVNNAGIAGPSAPIDKHDEDGWDKCIQVNLSGTFYMTRRAVPRLRQSGGGAIINVSSTAALHGYPLRSAYAASNEGIRVNAVCPTSVEGDRIDAVIRRDAEQRGLSFEQVREVYLRQTSMRTFVTPDDVADTILFLASDAANKISGQSISVDGHTEGLSNWLD
jgi:NAD(P)-dependent dehydrogenase (short-subunit alcohol dehydrogenase family)